MKNTKWVTCPNKIIKIMFIMSEMCTISSWSVSWHLYSIMYRSSSITLLCIIFIVELISKHPPIRGARQQQIWSNNSWPLADSTFPIIYITNSGYILLLHVKPRPKGLLIPRAYFFSITLAPIIVTYVPLIVLTNYHE